MYVWGTFTLPVYHSTVHYPRHNAVVQLVQLQSDSLKKTKPFRAAVWAKAEQTFQKFGFSKLCCFFYDVPWAHLCFSETGPGGLWWRFPGPGLHWRSPESLHSGRARQVGGSLVGLHHCKPRGRPRHGLAARPVVTRKQSQWRKSVHITETKDLEAMWKYCL